MYIQSIDSCQSNKLAIKIHVKNWSLLTWCCAITLLPHTYTDILFLSHPLSIFSEAHYSGDAAGLGAHTLSHNM